MVINKVTKKDGSLLGFSTTV